LTAVGGLAGLILKETRKVRLRAHTRACFGGQVRCLALSRACFGGQVGRSAGRVERLVRLQPLDRGLERFHLLVVVALGGEDRGVPEQVADLRERHALLDQPGRVLASKVVPVQVDLAQSLQAGCVEVLVAALAPPGVDAVGLERAGRRCR
jgi:hypothetical protein